MMIAKKDSFASNVTQMRMSQVVLAKMVQVSARRDKVLCDVANYVLLTLALLSFAVLKTPIIVSTPTRHV